MTRPGGCSWCAAATTPGSAPGRCRVAGSSSASRRRRRRPGRFAKRPASTSRWASCCRPSTFPAATACTTSPPRSSAVSCAPATTPTTSAGARSTTWACWSCPRGCSTSCAGWALCRVPHLELRFLQRRLGDGAERAAGGVPGDRALALRTDLGLLSRLGLRLEPLHHGVHRDDDEVVERQPDEDQRQDAVDEVAPEELRPVHREETVSEAVGAGDGRRARDRAAARVAAYGCADERRQEVLDQRVDDSGERGTDDDAGGEVDDVAAEDELAEAGQSQLRSAASEELFDPLGAVPVAHSLPLRVRPAARPLAATTSAIFRDASSIISSPSMTAPRRPPASDVECS